MEFALRETLPILQHTPAILNALLLDLPGPWTEATEGLGTWSPFDVVGHLIHGDRADWIPRIEHILRHGDAVPRGCIPRSDRGPSENILRPG